MFGSLALMAFVSLIVTGVVLTMAGPYWWHHSSLGHFVNSLHFWSVQVFFFGVFVHFGSSFFTAAWRGGRGVTWVLGALTFFVAILTGLTGYVLQSNYDAQWIGQQAKDAMNSIGLGYILQLMNQDGTGWCRRSRPRARGSRARSNRRARDVAMPAPRRARGCNRPSRPPANPTARRIPGRTAGREPRSGRMEVKRRRLARRQAAV
jgi:hypothetical protein